MESECPVSFRERESESVEKGKEVFLKGEEYNNIEFTVEMQQQYQVVTEISIIFEATCQGLKKKLRE